MASKPELWEKQDDGTVNWEFLLAYERSVLLSLQERGILTQQQYEECIRILECKFQFQLSFNLSFSLKIFFQILSFSFEMKDI